MYFHLLIIDLADLIAKLLFPAVQLQIFGVVEHFRGHHHSFVLLLLNFLTLDFIHARLELLQGQSNAKDHKTGKCCHSHVFIDEIGSHAQFEGDLNHSWKVPNECPNPVSITLNQVEDFARGEVLVGSC